LQTKQVKKSHHSAKMRKTHLCALCLAWKKEEGRTDARSSYAGGKRMCVMSSAPMFFVGGILDARPPQIFFLAFSEKMTENQP